MFLFIVLISLDLAGLSYYLPYLTYFSFFHFFYIMERLHYIRMDLDYRHLHYRVFFPFPLFLHSLFFTFFFFYPPPLLFPFVWDY